MGSALRSRTAAMPRTALRVTSPAKQGSDRTTSTWSRREPPRTPRPRFKGGRSPGLWWMWQPRRSWTNSSARTLAGLLETYGVSTYPASCLFADGAWLRANADRARRVAKAIAAGLEWVQNHRSDELAGLLPEWYRQRHEASTLTAVIDQARPLFSRTGAFTADGMDAARKVVAVSVEALRKSAVPATAYTNSYLPSRRK